MKDNLAETLLGGAVLAVAVGFFAYAGMRAGTEGASDGYSLHAVFPKVDGIRPGSEVRLSGVKVGSVSALRLVPERFYWARVDFTVRSDVKIPTDSKARIASDGLLGGAHVALEVGSAPGLLAAGGEIKETDGSVDVFSLLAGLAGGGQSKAEERQ